MMIYPGVEPGFQEPESCVRSITLADHNYSIIAYLIVFLKNIFFIVVICEQFLSLT